MNKLLQQLSVLWGRLLLAQKVTIIFAVGGLLAVLGVIIYGSAQTDYRLLARDLTRSQVAEIASFLDSNRVVFQVADGESAILVPAKDLYRLRNDLAQRSLLGDGVKGFELLDGSSMWDSSFREQKNYDRAVSGELERSFREMPGVKSARVLIDRPAPSPFMGNDDARPRASIKVDLQPGSRLTDRQIAGIIHLTSGAVAGLPPENVQVMDGGGLLTPREDEQGVGMASTVLEAEAGREAYLTRKAQEILDATLGRGRSQVKVSVKMDFTRRTEASTNPDKSVVLKEQTSTLDETTPVFGQAGVAGTASNVEAADSGTVTQSSANARKTNEEARNEYVVGNRTITQEDEVGRIRAMSVSILVDQRSKEIEKLDATGKPTGEMETEWQPVPAAELEQYKDLVLNSIGYHATRGSQTPDAAPQLDERFKATIQSIRMWRENEPAAAAVASALDPEKLRTWIGYGAAAIAALVFLLLARGQLKRSQAAWAAAEERTRLAAERAAQATPVPEEARDRRDTLKEDLARRIQEDPALAASILRKWIHGEA